MSLISMSLAGALLIVGILFVRTLSLARLPKKTFVILWEIAVVRLLVPFTFSSRLSIYGLLQEYLWKRGRNPSWRADPAFPLSPVLPASFSAGIQQEAGNGLPLKISVPLLLWVTGFILCLLFFLITYGKCRRRFSFSLPVQNAFIRQWLSEQKVRRRIAVRQTDMVNTPLTYGIFRPVILLPKSTISESPHRLAYVLTHELVHIRRFDTLRKGLFALTLCVHWFNPLVWVMYLVSSRDLELSCDEAVLRIFGEETRADYARLLIYMEEKRSAPMPLSNSFNKNTTEERITAIMKIGKNTIWKIIAACAVTLCIVLLFATNARPMVQKAVANNYAEAAGREAAHTLGTASTASIEQTIAQSADFSRYQELGIDYDASTSRLLYQGKPIGYFSDQTAPNTYTHLVYNDGEVGIQINRDENWNITDLKVLSALEIQCLPDTEVVEEAIIEITDADAVISHYYSE